jgi:hypothetical protein
MSRAFRIEDVRRDLKPRRIAQFGIGLVIHGQFFRVLFGGEVGVVFSYPCFVDVGRACYLVTLAVYAQFKTVSTLAYINVNDWMIRMKHDVAGIDDWRVCGDVVHKSLRANSGLEWVERVRK